MAKGGLKEMRAKEKANESWIERRIRGLFCQDEEEKRKKERGKEG